MANAVVRTIGMLGVLSLAGCGGGAGSNPATPVVPIATATPAATVAPSATSIARVTITDPSTGTFSRQRRPSHLPSSAYTIAISVNGGAPVSFPYAVNGPTCVVASPLNVCTFDVTVPTGNVTLVVKALNSKGSALSTATVQQVVSGTTAVPVTLAGIPARTSVTLAQSTMPAGTPGTVAITLAVVDSDGNRIGGPYATPVTLTNSDTSGHSSISPNLVSDPTTPVQLVLDGKPVNAIISTTLGGGVGPFASSLAAHEFTLPSGQPASPNLGSGAIAAGGDGGVWFAEQNGIARVDAAGTIAEYPMVRPLGMVRGPDGAVWFSAGFDQATGNASELCRVAANGSVTKFKTPGGNHLTVGADGNFWLVNAASSVWRVTPAGTVTTFALTAPPSLPGSNPRADDIAAGPDGNLWITDGLSGRVYVVSTAGVQVTAFGLPASAYSAVALRATFGQDGALWLTSQKEVVRMTNTGAVTEFSVVPGVLTFTAGGTDAAPILAGPDGNIWTAGASGDGSAAMFRMAMMPSLTLALPLPAVAPVNFRSTLPIGLSSGPNGTIWYVRANTVGWFSPPL
jgi:virginiamycin B lyase